MKNLARLKRLLYDRRGSQTIEYVTILAAGVALAMILNSVFGSIEIKNVIRDKIVSAFNFTDGKDQAAEKTKNQSSSNLLAVDPKINSDQVKKQPQDTGIQQTSSTTKETKAVMGPVIRGLLEVLKKVGGKKAAKEGAKLAAKKKAKSQISKETAELAKKHGIKLNGFKLKVRTKKGKDGKIEKWAKTNRGDEKKLRNGHLAGKKHPKTGVPFTKNGFPKFDKWSKGEVRIPKDYYLKSDPRQFKYASRRLWNKIKNDPKELKKFTKEQKEALKEGRKNVPGLTWHHHQQQGRMQLVEEKVHSGTNHTGGRDIWGGGRDFR